MYLLVLQTTNGSTTLGIGKLSDVPYRTDILALDLPAPSNLLLLCGPDQCRELAQHL